MVTKPQLILKFCLLSGLDKRKKVHEDEDEGKPRPRASERGSESRHVLSCPGVSPWLLLPSAGTQQASAPTLPHLPQMNHWM